jgi:hypothetical protein
MAPLSRAEAFALLGLPMTASPAEVTGAYRRLAKLSHPDATGRSDDEAGQSFAALTDAYRAAADPVRRSPARPPGSRTPPTPPSVDPPAWQRPQTLRQEPSPLPSAPPPIVAGPVTIRPYRSGPRRSR